MKTFIKFCGLMPASLIVSLLFMQPLHASSSFNSTSLVSFTLTGIANLTNPGNLTNLDVTGAFSLDNNSSITANAIILDYNSSPLSSPVTAGNSFSQSLGASGIVGNDTATAYFLATRNPQTILDPNLANLLLQNNSTTDTYQIDIAMDYTLTANASGDFANTDISLDYYSLNSPSFSGFDSVYASAYLSPYSETKANTVLLSLILTPTTIEGLYADVTLNGHISAVPLPAAFWLFLSALMTMPVFRKTSSLSTSNIH